MSGNINNIPAAHVSAFYSSTTTFLSMDSFFFVACLSNGSKMYSGDKLVYPTIYHKRSELFKYFSGLRRIAQGEKSVNCLSSCLFGCGHEIEA